jgi:hypothetical protein
VIYRVIGSVAEEARPFLANLKERLKADFDQEEILIVERDVETRWEDMRPAMTYTIVVWSLLGLTAVGFGYWRRKRAA